MMLSHKHAWLGSMVHASILPHYMIACTRAVRQGYDTSQKLITDLSIAVFHTCV